MSTAEIQKAVAEAVAAERARAVGTVTKDRLVAEIAALVPGREADVTKPTAPVTEADRLAAEIAAFIPSRGDATEAEAESADDLAAQISALAPCNV